MQAHQGMRQAGRQDEGKALPRIAVVHIGKTAGTTLVGQLSRHYPDDLRSPHIMGLKRPDPTQMQSLRLIPGHFGFSYAEKTGAELVTVFRDPVDRIVSLYHFWRQLPERQMVREMTLSEFAQSNAPSIVIDLENTQTWQIAHEHIIERRKDLAGISDEQLLQRAKDNLERFKVVGITENMPKLAMDIETAWGIRVDLTPRWNRTNGRVSVDEISAEERELIEKRTYLDAALYHYAVARFRLNSGIVGAASDQSHTS